jgi:hypothetical protein
MGSLGKKNSGPQKTALTSGNDDAVRSITGTAIARCFAKTQSHQPAS